MPTTTGNFSNSYTFTIGGNTSGHESSFALIEANAIAVINYLSDYMSWNGTMDFTVQFGTPTQFGHNGTGLLPSYGGVGFDNNTYAQSEAVSGVDANGSDFDAGAWILPNSNGSITNYNVPIHFDPTPDAYEIYSPPAGTHDFFSIYLHEVLHSFGFWSVAQHGPEFGQSSFDSLTQEVNGGWYFMGANTQALLGQPLQLATSGSRDHYAGTNSSVPGFPEVDRGTVFEFGNYEGNRWHLGQLDLVILKDLGWTVGNENGLAIVELPDNSPNLTGSNFGEQLFGDHQNNILDGLGGADTIGGNQGNDTIRGGEGDDWLYGNAGIDTINGGTGLDRIWGGADGDSIGGDSGNDFLNGQDGNDWIWGGEDHDTVGGDGGNDNIFGGNGNDWLYGGSGNDNLNGDGDNDVLFGIDGLNALGGGAGNDTIHSGFNHDWTWGGAGADKFHFAGWSWHDFIQDFEDGVDKIDLAGEGWGYTSSNQISIVNDANGDAFISLGYNTWITVHGISAGQLTDTDFIF